MFEIRWHYCFVRSKICKIPWQYAQAGSRIPWIQQNYSVRDPISLGSHGNVAVTGSRIFKIPWENGNIRSKTLQDPGSWILDIQGLGHFEVVEWWDWRLACWKRHKVTSKIVYTSISKVLLFIFISIQVRAKIYKFGKRFTGFWFYMT